jgi:Ca2+-binding RTX toxin-like protein
MAIVTGTSGNDRADLGGANLVGTSSADEIYGFEGDDWLEGGDGNDLLDAGTGDFNSVFGGAGNDLVRTAGYGGFFDGGSGFDTIRF